jgi:hypothetical protein
MRGTSHFKINCSRTYENGVLRSVQLEFRVDDLEEGLAEAEQALKVAD